MKAARDLAKLYAEGGADSEKAKDKALAIINAYSVKMQRLDGHDAPLCAIQCYDLVRAMTILRNFKSDGWDDMIRRVMFPMMDKFEADSPYANGNWGAIVNRLRMACGIYLQDKRLYQASIDYFSMPTTTAHCQTISARLANVRKVDVTKHMHSLA